MLYSHFLAAQQTADGMTFESLIKSKRKKLKQSGKARYHTVADARQHKFIDADTVNSMPRC